MKIYVVKVGAYSDRYVSAVFTDKAKVDLYAVLFNEKPSEFESDPEVPAVPEGLFVYHVRMFRNGDIDRTQRGADDESDVQSAIEGRTEILYNYVLPSQIYVWCLAEDDKHAIKIANEKRTQAIALGRWVEGKRST